MHKQSIGSKRDDRSINHNDRIRRNVRFQDSSPTRTANTSGSAISVPTDKTAAGPSQSPMIGVQAVLCGVLIAIVAGASFARLYRSTARPSEELSPAIKAYIDRTVSRAMRDPVGRLDFALYANGGRVIHDLTTVIPGEGSAEIATGVENTRADLAITEDARIGQCWLIPGSSAQLGLRLSELMYPTHISIDHIPAEIAFDISQAPRTMVLWGTIDGSTNAMNIKNLSATSLPGLRGRTQPLVTCNHTYVPLALLEYDIRAASNVQTFRIGQDWIDAGVYTGVVILEILGNWGGSATCLYRVRIHGEPRGDVV